MKMSRVKIHWNWTKMLKQQLEKMSEGEVFKGARDKIISPTSPKRLWLGARMI